MKNSFTASLQAANLVPSTGNVAELRSANAFSDSVEVDETAGIIKNAAIMTCGEAEGHGFSIDQTTIEQLSALINAAGQVKVRFKHPQTIKLANGQAIQPDDLGSDVGYIKDAHVVGNAVRGDVHLAEHAKDLPGGGNVWNYLLSKAKRDPGSFGLSAVIHFDAELTADPEGTPTGLVARITAVDAVDFVGTPAANPNGLLASQTQTQKEPEPKQILPTAGVLPAAKPLPKPAARAAISLSQGQFMDPTLLKAYLVKNCSLAADATDEQAQAMFDAMTPEQQASCKAQMSADKAATATELAKRNASITDDGSQLLALEQRRVTQLSQLGKTLNVDDSVVQLAIANNENLIDAKKRFLTFLSEKCKPVPGPATISVGNDQNLASLIKALPDALRIKAQCNIKDPAPRAQELSSVRMIQMGRIYLSACGVDSAHMLSEGKVWEMLVRPEKFGGRYAQLAQSTDSFTNITLDAANKTLRQAYLDKPAGWTQWARRATTPDFKNINRVALSDAPSLVSRKEAAENKYANLSDNKETYVVTEYVGQLRLTRQAMVNDDMDAFGRIPMLQGYAARRKEDDVAYAILTANANLSDGVALFAVATHANLEAVTANVGAPSVAALSSGRKAMRVQTGPKGAILNLVPRFLIVPAALETLAYQFTSVSYFPALATNVNPFSTGGATPLTPIIEPRLDANSATYWYLLAGNDQIDTIEVAFLQDEPEPVLKQEVDFDTDDVKFAVRHTMGAKAIDYRGCFANPGA